MLITVTPHADEASLAKARELSERHRIRFVDRQGISLKKLGKMYKDPQIMVVTKELQLRWCDGDAAPMIFHPSTAYLRIQRMTKGQEDFAMKLCGVRRGDRILDCTAGLGADALVFAYTAGETGGVTAVESALPLYMILQDGLATYETPFKALRGALRRVEPRLGDHLEVLKRLPDKSLDVVYFDPMFRHPLEESAAIAGIRSVADPRPIREEAVREACRIARRVVVLKERRDSGEFERLGFVRHTQRQSPIAYGVIELAG